MLFEILLNSQQKKNFKFLAWHDMFMFSLEKQQQFFDLMFLTYQKIDLFSRLEKTLLKMIKIIPREKSNTEEFKVFEGKIKEMIEKIKFQKKNHTFLIDKKSITYQYKVEKK